MYGRHAERMELGVIIRGHRGDLNSRAPDGSVAGDVRPAIVSGASTVMTHVPGSLGVTESSDPSALQGL